MGILGSIVGSAADFLGSKHLQDDSQAYSREQMKNAMQWRVEDLKRAGLNPMMAASSGLSGPGMPSGGGAPSFTGGSSAYRNTLESKSVDAEVKLKDAMTRKTQGDTLSPGVADEVARGAAGLSVASAGRADQEVINLQAQVGEIGTRIANMESEIAKRGAETLTIDALRDLQVLIHQLDAKAAALGIPVKEAFARGAERLKSGDTAIGEITGFLRQKLSDNFTENKEWLDAAKSYIRRMQLKLREAITPDAFKPTY